MMELVNFIAVMIGLSAVLLFTVVYSRTKWERTPEGRNLMGLPIVFVLLSITATYGRIGQGDAIIAGVLSTTAWMLVGYFMTVRTVHVIRAQRAARKEETDDKSQENKESEV